MERIFNLRNKIFLLIILGNIIFSYSQAQNIDLTGIVKDAISGESIPGANVSVKGTKTGTVTDIDGKFSLKVAENSVLIFSFIGYEQLEIKFDKNTKIEAQLKPSNKSLDEIVVIGYGQTTKKEVTGSITSVKSEGFNKGSYNDAMGLLQGKVAGLSITKPNGADPQSGYSILLRGTNTLLAGQGPLIIIDGVAGADMKNINFEEVESMDVLKDGSAAAIYGTRGTNGVIIITTKRAKTGKTSIEYSGQVSAQVNTRMVENLSASEFKEAVLKYAPDKASANLYGSSTNWFKEITRDMPISHKHSVAMFGGDETFSHRTTFNMDKNQGLLKDNESNKFLVKTNINQKFFDKKLILDYNISYNKRDYKPANYDLFYQAFVRNPTMLVYDKTNTTYGGYFTMAGLEYYNPVAMLKERNRNGKTTDIGTNVRATLKLIENLNWVSFFSREESDYEETSYKTKYYPSSVGKDGEAEISNGKSYNIQFETMFNYNYSYKNNNIQAVGGYSYQEQGSNSSFMGNSGFDTDSYDVNNIGDGSSLGTGKAEMDSEKEDNKLISFFGRIMYNYEEKYLASVSLRKEGSTRFGEDSKWGLFPAVSLGWRINKEDFMKEVSCVNDLKVRFGYGVTGNQDFINHNSLALMKATYGRFLYKGNWINAYEPVRNPNPDFQWEEKSEYDLGIDFSLFNNRLSGTIDGYYRKSTDLIYEYDVSTPPYINNKLLTNIGVISNKGIELTINGIPFKNKDLQWTTTFTFSKNINKLDKLSNSEFNKDYVDLGWIGGSIGINCQRMQEGKSLGRLWGPKWIGVDEYGNDKFKNANPVGKVDSKDWEEIGNAFPFCSLGWSNSVTFKNFDFSCSFRANIGGDVLNSYRLYYENWGTIGLRNIVASQLDNPKFTGTTQYSSKYVEDATFLKLDNVTIGYNWKSKIKYVSKVRFSLTAQDVFCITKYKGLDPEVNLSGLTPGIESLSYYPRTTTITFGTNITF